MARDRVLDPILRDYVPDGVGGYEATATLQPQIHHQLLSRAGEWAGDPDSGSTIHTIPRKNNQTTLLRIQDAWLAALKPFVDEGLAEDLSVEIARDSVNHLSLVASIRDKQYGEIDLDSLIPFGAGEGA